MDYVDNPLLRVANVLNTRAIEDSADFAQAKMKNAIIMFDESKQRMFDYIQRIIPKSGLIAEFGVANGYSINSMAIRLPNRTLYGFDSFKGMPEDMVGWEVFRGDFSLDGFLPEVQPNVSLVQGYFDETLPTWLENNSGEFAFINIDCDTYGSTKTVLESIGKQRLKPKTIILFDEFFGFNNWRNHEYKAWREFSKKNKLKFEYVAINHMQVLVKIL